MVLPFISVESIQKENIHTYDIYGARYNHLQTGMTNEILLRIGERVNCLNKTYNHDSARKPCRFFGNIYFLCVSYDILLITQGAYTLPISWIKIKHILIQKKN